MSIATKTGDKGTTSLLMGGRVSKAHPIIEAVGTLDELNAALGLVKIVPHPTYTFIYVIQNDLVKLMGEITTSQENEEKYQQSKFKKIDEQSLNYLDVIINQIESTNPTFKDWETPGNNEVSSRYDYARTIARRAERQIIRLKEDNIRTYREIVYKYINRLSDTLWLLARKYK
jgi:cob(I)alamin adenosyltransferase